MASEKRPVNSFEEQKRKAKVRRFIDAVVSAAIDDAREGIGEYDQRNTGERLMSRLNLSEHRTFPRNGDPKYARSLYTAARWLYNTEIDN